MTTHDSSSASDHQPALPPPPFLTVEEAAAVLRIGRTTAYAQAQRWLATDGAEGLPVIRVGRSLRVPYHQLERLAAGPISADAVLSAQRPSASPAPPSAPSAAGESSPSDLQPSLFEQAS